MAIDDLDAFRLYRWDELPLEKVTEMVSRKIVSGTREMVAQHYMKKGALVPVLLGQVRPAWLSAPPSARTAAHPCGWCCSVARCGRT